MTRLDATGARVDHGIVQYKADIYQGAEGRSRWAVCHAATGVWYFPSRHGQAAAHSMARRLNAEAT